MRKGFRLGAIIGVAFLIGTLAGVGAAWFFFQHVSRIAVDAALISASQAIAQRKDVDAITNICHAVSRDPDRYLSYGLLGDVLVRADARVVAAALYYEALRRTDLPQDSSILGRIEPTTIAADRAVLQDKVKSLEGAVAVGVKR
jgi:hypothetical protein